MKQVILALSILAITGMADAQANATSANGARVVGGPQQVGPNGIGGRVVGGPQQVGIPGNCATGPC